MEKSNSISSIAKALIAFHLKVGKISKDAKNPFFKSTYASLSNILESIDTPLAESGLAFTQFPTGEHGLSTILMHGESGEWIQSEYKMRPAKDDPQGIGSSITYQRRYALASVLGLNIDDDDDANSASGSQSKQDTTAADDKPWLNKDSKEFTGAVEKMKAGKSNIEALRKYFKISKAVESLLIEQSKSELV